MHLFSGWWTVWAMRNILVHVLYMYLHIHTHIPRSRITGSLGLCWTLLAVFQNACTSLHSYHQSMRVSIVPHSHQHFTVFLHFSHSGGGVEESHYGLMFLSLRTNEVRQHSDVCCTSRHSYEVSVEVFFHFFYWVGSLLCIDLTKSFTYSGYKCLGRSFLSIWYKHDIHTWQRIVSDQRLRLCHQLQVHKKWLI